MYLNPLIFFKNGSMLKVHIYDCYMRFTAFYGFYLHRMVVQIANGKGSHHERKEKIGTMFQIGEGVKKSQKCRKFNLEIFKSHVGGGRKF